MERYVSFASTPKGPLHVSVPESLIKRFREHAKEQRLKPNELITYVLCEILGEDPTEYGLHPLKRAVVSDE